MIIRLFIIFLLAILVIIFSWAIVTYKFEDVNTPYHETSVVSVDRATEVVIDYEWAFDSIVEFVIQREGYAYVNDTTINEESRMGITKQTFRSYYGNVDKRSIINLKKEQAIPIYKDLFWNRNNLDSLVSRGYINTAIALMDSEVNLGSYRANIIFQRAIGVPREDRNGRINDATLMYLDSCEVSDDVLYKKLIQKRRSFYARLVKKYDVYAKYQKGWNNRLDSIVTFVEKLNES